MIQVIEKEKSKSTCTYTIYIYSSVFILDIFIIRTVY